MKKEVHWFPPPGRCVTQLLALFLLALSVDLAASTHGGKLKYCTFLLVRFPLYCAREHFRRAVEQVDTNWVLTGRLRQYVIIRMLYGIYTSPNPSLTLTLTI